MFIFGLGLVCGMLLTLTVIATVILVEEYLFDRRAQQARYEAVTALAQMEGISYEEADKLVTSDPI